MDRYATGTQGMNWLLLSAAWAGPNTVMVGVDAKVNASGFSIFTDQITCLSKVPLCMLELAIPRPKQ